MACEDKNNNDVSCNKSNINYKKKSSSVKPRNSEYNLPSMLTDFTKSPSRIYQRGNLLGTGGFAKVFQVQDESTGVYYADKVISKAMFIRKKNSKQKVEREIYLHRKMKHENVIIFHGFFEDINYVHLLLELAPNKTLLHVSKFRKVITECEVKYYTKQIMNGVDYIHSIEVLHRDLKLGNMFLSTNLVVKIGDFGLATSFADNQPGNLCGTPNYIAPEVLAKAGHSIASEVWSIGCMVYALLCGAPPFETQSVSSTYKLISKCHYEIPSHLSSSAAEFIQYMLVKDPSSRGLLSGHSTFDINLQAHSFLVEGFVPPRLPRSALFTPPVFSDQITNPVPDQIPVVCSAAVDIPDQSEENTGCGTFSPSKNCSFRKRVFGLFTQKGKFLDQVTSAMLDCLASNSSASLSEVPVGSKIAPLFVSKWVDYSNKFGFGFQMSDGSVGVLFNDSTKIGTSPLADIVEFTDMRGKAFCLPLEENDNQPFPELNHRVSLLKYYMQYMEENLADSVPFLPGVETIKTGQKSEFPQLRRWNRRGDYITMELNNHSVQVNHMADHVKVVVWMYNGDMLCTVIATKCQTFSLSRPCPQEFIMRLEDTLQEVREMADVKGNEENI